jgi:uncharacterized integral membrane protein
MGFGYVAVAVLAVIVTVFALQNTDPATVRFLAWRIEAIPVAGLVLASFFAGALIVAVPLAIRLGIWRSRARSLETRVNATTLDKPPRRTPPQPSPPLD